MRVRVCVCVCDVDADCPLLRQAYAVWHYAFSRVPHVKEPGKVNLNETSVCSTQRIPKGTVFCSKKRRRVAGELVKQVNWKARRTCLIHVATGPPYKQYFRKS